MKPLTSRLSGPLLAAAAAATATCPYVSTASVPMAATESGAVILAAGDIAKCSSSGDEATAAVLSAHPEGTVVSLGDHVYPDGTLSQFASCYEPTWGQHKTRTRPTPGNHEYRTPGAAGYFDYFGAAAGERGKGYYSYELEGWHIVVLNSNCSKVGGCGAGSAQEQWLRADLAAHPSDCTLAYWHHPLFSSTRSDSTPTVQPLWQALYEAGADVVLNGHAHSYERFAAQNPEGQADPRGLTQFVVGTGGASHRDFATAEPNSVVRDNTTFGVLGMTLLPGGYTWEFKPAGGSFTDAGSGACVTGTTPPPPPSSLLRSPGFELDMNAQDRPGWLNNNAFVGPHRAADPSTA